MKIQIDQIDETKQTAFVLFPNRLCTRLQIGIADGGIEIQRRFLDSLELFEIPRPFIDDLSHAGPSLDEGHRRIVVDHGGYAVDVE